MRKDDIVINHILMLYLLYKLVGIGVGAYTKLNNIALTSTVTPDMDTCDPSYMYLMQTNK